MGINYWSWCIHTSFNLSRIGWQESKRIREKSYCVGNKIGEKEMKKSTILAGSDFEVSGYKEFIQMSELYEPNLVLLAGDLISFQEEFISDFIEKRRMLMRSFGIEMVEQGYVGKNVCEFLYELNLLKHEYRKTKFHKIMVKEFYKFLRHISRSSKVFLVKGNHDDDFGRGYDVDRINSIKNCYEISGRLVTFHDIRILGLGYYETHYLRTLRPLIEKMKGNVDIVLAHVEEKRLTLISKICPKFILRGHFGLNISIVGRTPIIPCICSYKIDISENVIEFDKLKGLN